MHAALLHHIPGGKLAGLRYARAAGLLQGRAEPGEDMLPMEGRGWWLRTHGAGAWERGRARRKGGREDAQTKMGQPGILTQGGTSGFWRKEKRRKICFVRTQG